MLAIKILTFSIRFGEFTAIDLSRIKPVISSERDAPHISTTIPTFVKIRISQLATDFFDDLNVLKVCRALEGSCQAKCKVFYKKHFYLQPKDGIDSKVRKVILVLREDF